jgi:hypothetical protein
MPRFLKRLIAAQPYESAAITDVNGDGQVDIVSGAWWYEGPTFTRRHRIWDPPDHGDYHDDFASIVLDPSDSGFPDLITGGWVGQTLYRLRNPGPAGGRWQVETIATPGNIETIRAWDIDGDGELEIIPNCPNGPLIAYDRVDDTFVPRLIHPGPQGHGLGCGDLAGHGRMDLVLAEGWLEAPDKPWSEPWTFHPGPDLGRASVPIIVADVDGDGRSDLIVGQAHDYGLHWWQQQRDGEGKIHWQRHDIDPYVSQYHDLIWCDIDGDGQAELITGKRYYAHCGTDPGADDPLETCIFKWTGEVFVKQTLASGPPGEGCGVGIHFAVGDLTGDGRPDIVAPGKDGLYVFFNLGP